MAVFSRKQLRQRLGVDLLRDTYVGINTASLAASVSTGLILDFALADPSFSADTRYARAWAKHNGMVYRAATFNFASGAFVSAQVAPTTTVAGGEYEIHELIDPRDKDRALDWSIDRLWVRQEVAIAAVDGQFHYSIGYEFGRVFDWWVNDSPNDITTRGKRTFVAQQPEIRVTGSGRELRLYGALSGSQQIVLDAEVRLTLGTQDTATINLPDNAYEQMVLYGAEAQCWEMIAKRASAQDRRAYLTNAQRASAAYSRLSQRFSPQRDSAPRFRNPMSFTLPGSG